MRGFFFNENKTKPRPPSQRFPPTAQATEIEAAFRTPLEVY